MLTLNKYLLAGLTVSAIAAFFFIHTLLQKKQFATFTIGLVHCPTSLFHDQVHQALLTKINGHPSFKARDFAIANITDLILVNNVCELAIESDADVLICTGYNSTQALATLSRKRNILKPIIFLGISDPVERGIVDNLKRPGKNITGVQSVPVNAVFNPIELLLHVKPTAKRILLPYLVIPGGQEAKANEAAAICKEKGVAITLLPIDDKSNPLLMITSALPGHDVLMYVEADGISHHGIALGKLASQHNVTMFAGSIDGIQGAALGYTSTPICLAITAFELAKLITLKKIPAGEIAIQDSFGYRELIINTDLCDEQDLKNINIAELIAAIKKEPRFAQMHDHITIQKSH